MTQLISPQEAAQLVRESGAVLVDVREPEEYRAERIPGAAFEPLSVLRLLPDDPQKDKPAVYFCRSGRRTENAAEQLEARGHSRTYVIRGGLRAWEDAGLPVEKSLGPPPLMRQVHIAAGSLVLLFTILGRFSGLFSLFAGLVGLGLLMSGLTGACGMALLLKRMPWNKE